MIGLEARDDFFASETPSSDGPAIRGGRTSELPTAIDSPDSRRNEASQRYSPRVSDARFAVDGDFFSPRDGESFGGCKDDADQSV